MKKILLALAVLVVATPALPQAVPYSVRIEQADVSGSFFWGRYFYPTAGNSYFLMYDGATNAPVVGSLGSSISFTGGTLSFLQAQSDWSASSGVSMIANKPVIPAQVLRTRAQTNASGTYTWTFPTPFGVGVTPVVSITVEDASAATWNHQITAISNTSVTIQLGKSVPVTILAISVLGVAATPQAYVHLMAVTP